MASQRRELGDHVNEQLTARRVKDRIDDLLETSDSGSYQSS